MLVAFAPVSMTSERVLAQIPVAPLDEAQMEIPAAPSGASGRVEFETMGGGQVVCAFIVLDAAVFATGSVYCLDPTSDQAQLVQSFVEGDMTDLPIFQYVREAALELQFLFPFGRRGSWVLLCRERGVAPVGASPPGRQDSERCSFLGCRLAQRGRLD